MSEQIRMGEVQRWRFATAAAGGTSEEARITITTPSLDHYNDRVLPEGVDRSAFDLNPAILWLHDAYGTTAAAGIPIGRATALSVTRSGITAAWRWLQGDAFVDRVRNAWTQGILGAASIGFIPIESTPNERGGFDISRWKLLEFSLVPIPANPEAVRSLQALARSARPGASADRLLADSIRDYFRRELAPRPDSGLAQGIREYLARELVPRPALSAETQRALIEGIEDVIVEGGLGDRRYRSAVERRHQLRSRIGRAL